MHHDERRVSKVHGLPASLNHNHLYTHARYTGQRMYNSYRLCWACKKGIGFTSIPQPSPFTQGYLHDKSILSLFHDLYHIARYNPLDFEDRLWSQIRNTLCIHKKYTVHVCSYIYEHETFMLLLVLCIMNQKVAH